MIKRYPCVFGVAITAAVLSCNLSSGYEFELVMRKGQEIEGQTVVQVYYKEPLPVSFNNSREFPFLVELEGETSAIATAKRIIAKTGDIIGGDEIFIRDEDQEPKITDEGEVLFSTLDVLVLGDRVILRTGDVISGQDQPLDLIDFGPSINRQGQIAFVGSVLGVGGVIATPEAVVARMSDTIGGKSLTNFYDAKVLENGRVVFGADYLEDRQLLSGVFAADEPLFLDGTVVDGRTIERPALIGETHDGTFLYRGFSENQQLFLTEQEILVAAGDVVDGREITELSFVSSNSAGHLAYVANFPDGGGVFVDDKLVVGLGDTVDGVEISRFGRAIINETGDLAISVRLGHDDWGMMVALVPEPTSPIGFALGLLPLAVTMRRPRK